MSSKNTQRNHRPTPHRKSKQLLPALIAVGGACSLAATPAAALELGEIQVNSALGQPLRASIAYALNPTEQLANYCIYLRPGAGNSEIPLVTNAQVSVTDRAIILTGTSPVREPMLSMQVVVDCPYTPHLLREYTLMVDPVAPAYVPAAASRTTQAAPENTIARPTISEPVATVTENVATARRPVVTNSAPIGQGSSYVVQPGDTLSTIVSRIEGRTMKLWPSVNAIFAANPDAFINNDVNRIMAGKTLLIPDLVGAAPSSAQTTSAPASSAPTTANTVADDANLAIDLGVAPQPMTVEVPTDIEVAPTLEPVVVDPVDGSLEVTSPANNPVADLQPGDVVITPTNVGETEILIPDTIIEDETATRVTTVVDTDATGTSGSWNWLIWLGGSGLALILGLLLFGRSIRERFGASPVGAGAVSGRRQSDDPTQERPIPTEIDYEFEDTINSRAISLDADFDEGTGLNQNLADVVTEDYGVATPADDEDTFDLEITAESAFAPETEESQTDVIAPHHRTDPTSILDSEEPPVSDEEEYDLSMIVDATKQPLGDNEDTATDLQAVEINSDHPGDEDDYTLSKEVDYQVLEQDYEDELTATQALNVEVMKAAEELATRMDVSDDGQITEEIEKIIEPTNKLKAVEKTQELPATDEAAAAAPATATDPGHTAELTINLPTDFEAVNDENVDCTATVEMTAAGSDITVEMQVESGKVDTKKK